MQRLLSRWFPRRRHNSAPPVTPADIQTMLQNTLYYLHNGEASPLSITRSTTNLADNYFGALQTTLQQQTSLDDTILAQLYLVGVTAWTCVNAAASIASSIDLRVVNNEKQRYTTPTPLDAVMQWQRRLIWLYIFSIKLWGKCYWLKQRNYRGYPTGLVWVNPLDIEPVLDYRTGQVHRWRIAQTDGSYTEYHPQDVVAYYNFNPTDPLDGLSPYEMIYKQIVAEDNIRNFVRAFFQNAARPDGMLTFSGTLPPGGDEKVREDWQQFRGLSNAGKTFIATAPSGEWKWTPITAPLPDTGMKDNRAAIIADTCGVMQVNPILTGLYLPGGTLGGDSVNSFKQARLNHMQFYAVPDVQNLCETLTAEWASEFNILEPYILEPDTESILSETQATSERSGVANTIFNSNLGTLDEARRLVGLGAAPDGIIQRNPAPLLTVWQNGIITYGEFRLALGLELDKPEWGDLRIWEVDPSKKSGGAPMLPGRSSSPREDPPFFLRRDEELNGSALLSLAYNPALADLPQELPGDYLPSEEWHLTLVMFDQLDTAQAQDLAWAAEALPAPTLTVTGYGSFDLEDDAYTLHLEVEPTPDLKRLQQKLVDTGTQLGLTVGDYSALDAYHPHITLAYLDTPPDLASLPPLPFTTLKPTLLALSHDEGGEWFDLHYVPLVTSRAQGDDLTRWQKVRKKYPTRAFRPDALSDDVSQWIAQQFEQGWNETVVFEAARAWLDTGIPPLPLGASHEDYLRYWTTFDQLQPTLGDDFITYMAGLSQETIWNALAVYDLASTPSDAQNFTLPVHKSEEQALVNEWAGTPQDPGSLANFVLAGGASGDALLDTARAQAPYRLGETVQAVASWTLSPTDAVKKARQYGAKLIKDLNETTQAAIRELLAQAIEKGWTRNDLAEAIGSLLAIAGKPGENLLNRAKLIAQTESVKAYNLGAFDRWKDAGIKEAVWQTVRDDHVCFPAFSPVLTDKGQQPIQSIQVGDKVLTRQGYKRVKTTMRTRYSGDMIEIMTPQGNLTSTGNHPIFTLEQGWLAARDVQVGHTLQNSKQELIQVTDTRQVFVGDMDHSKPSLFQTVIAALFFGLILMPIYAIYFYGNQVIQQDKVYAQASQFIFLLKGYLKALQGFSNGTLWQGFPLIQSFAAETTKSSRVFLRGNNPKFFPTMVTDAQGRGTPTQFRTIMSRIARIILEGFAATFTGNQGMLGMFPFAFQTAIGIPMGSSNLYNKRALATRTNLDSQLGLAGIIVAIITTIFLAAFYAGLIAVERLLAMSTDQLLTLFIIVVVALGTTKMAFGFGKLMWLGFIQLTALVTGSTHGGGISFIQSSLLVYHRWRGYSWVYNLEVEDEHEYFAYDLLVHNCMTCNSLHGVVGSITTGWVSPYDGQTYYEMAHPGCRCFRRPVVPGTARHHRLLKLLQPRSMRIG